jgi:hypothetical protein
MTQTCHLTTIELASKIKYDERNIRERLKDNVLLEGTHCARPVGGLKVLYLWENIECDMRQPTDVGRIAIPMLAHAGANQRSWLVPLVDADSSADETLTGSTPMDTWCAIEDLWTRLSAGMAMTVENDGDAFRVVLPGFERAGDALELRRAVLDPDTYRWATQGGSGSFVGFVDYDGDDLVLQMPSMRQIERWPDGADLAWQVKGYLLRLRHMSRVQAAST